MPVRLSAWISFIQSGGNAGRTAATLLDVPGVAGVPTTEAAAQLPTRQLSWAASISCTERPVGPDGQGGLLLYFTFVTTSSGFIEVAGITRVSVSPSGCKVPVNASKTELVAP